MAALREGFVSLALSLSLWLPLPTPPTTDTVWIDGLKIVAQRRMDGPSKILGVVLGS